MPETRLREARQILENAELIHPAEAVDEAVRRVAGEITGKLADTHPILLCVMSGGVPFAGRLMTLLNFPLDFDYLHVTRYRQNTSGGALSWRSAPWISVKGRTVLVVDDILDEGVTLAAVRDRLLQQGAEAVYMAVFANKDKGTEKPVRADFVALTVPNRYVFGFGMDVHGIWRNLPAIYAIRDPAGQQ
ncbi:MAG: hypoxanthine-guanine phosphoribosyltransferase [Betaproteobacteria bacterium]|nr:hypoxanthine-guanine phosphoribosyltransferase [Betaproteobacteria bacterium]